MDASPDEVFRFRPVSRSPVAVRAVVAGACTSRSDPGSMAGPNLLAPYLVAKFETIIFPYIASTRSSPRMGADIPRPPCGLVRAGHEALSPNSDRTDRRLTYWAATCWAMRMTRPIPGAGPNLCSDQRALVKASGRDGSWRAYCVTSGPWGGGSPPEPHPFYRFAPGIGGGACLDTWLMPAVDP